MVSVHDRPACDGSSALFFRFKRAKHKLGVKVRSRVRGLGSLRMACFRCVVVEKNNIPYFETSAKEGLNVEKAFETVARNALAREKEIDQQADFPMPIRIPQQEEQPKKEGCGC